ncbi:MULTISPECIES: hypothetical protein [unclassified Corynebacterium]|uniref:hypothetical protein n=1 Tax=unclassified Corynebacterium TaxID=2624378 RepID=UPI0029CA9213|nr:MULTISPECIES: hypothetical protein [unclassified Corynebacterium]WPF65421.1 hypothetical protein OLX12_07500 [Corynebacterium sp. 22KM0430]WPF67917.1 hypothetical protein OLW90_07495 [Corynebacterium sp. 21KM1197]
MGQHERYDAEGTDTLVGMDYPEADYREQATEEGVYPVTGPSPQDHEPVSAEVWAGIGKAVVGLIAMIGVLAMGQDMGAYIERWGYVPVMLVYMVAMMCAGALLTAGAMGIWATVKSKRSGERA